MSVHCLVTCALTILFFKYIKNIKPLSLTNIDGVPLLKVYPRYTYRIVKHTPGST